VIDPAFAGLPLRALADSALGRAGQRSARQATIRVKTVRQLFLRLRDGVVSGGGDTTATGLGIRLTHGSAWGFAGTTELTCRAAADTADAAVAMARACAPLDNGALELAAEPVYLDATWASACQVNPFEVAEDDRVELLADWSRRLLATEVSHVLASVVAVQENTFYADDAGTMTTQQRIRVHPQVLAVGTDPRTGLTRTLRTAGPPTARGWEYLTGPAAPGGWDWHAELAQMPDHLAEKLRARPAEPGNHDLVIDPSNLWLTIHESVGHATELDRALGHEVGYAGTTFAAPGQIGSLRYGSSLMNIVADRTAEYGLATVGFDDEGVAAQSWDLVRNGMLAGFQADRRTAWLAGARRSNGCGFAESALHPPLSRMPNVSLAPAPGGPSTEDLIGGVANGLYLVGSGSWSIDTRRSSFQFTAQRCHLIRRGRLAGQVAEVAYQATTMSFWNSLRALGGEQTYQLFGADQCGKGQPVQLAAASHGCPPALFERVRVINAAAEAGR
jgi:TldD protein